MSRVERKLPQDSCLSLRYQQEHGAPLLAQPKETTSTHTIFETPHHILKIPIENQFISLETGKRYLHKERDKLLEIIDDEEFEVCVCPIFLGTKAKRLGEKNSTPQTATKALILPRFSPEQHMAQKVLSQAGEGRLSQELSGHIKAGIDMIFDYHQAQERTPEDENRARFPSFWRERLTPDFKVLKNKGKVDIENLEGLIHGNYQFLTHPKIRAAVEQAIENGMIKKSHGDFKLDNTYLGDGIVGQKGKLYPLDPAVNPVWETNDLRSEIAYWLLQFNSYDPNKFNQVLQIANQKYQELMGANLISDPMFWFGLNHRAIIEAVGASCNGDKAIAEKYIKMAKNFLSYANGLAVIKRHNEKHLQ